MGEPLRLLSSRATERLLGALADDLAARHGVEVAPEAAGGVDIARRVRGGERADLVVLAAGALAELDAAGLLVPGSTRPLFVSEVALAVPAAAPVPRLSTEDDLAAVLAAAPRTAYSTGPSGTALLAWLDARGLRDRLADRLVQAPPGTPVARLLADGDADVGVQQVSELADLPDVRVVGALPGGAAVTSTFAGAVLRSTRRPEAAGAALDLLGAPGTRALVQAHHMTPAADATPPGPDRAGGAAV